MVKWGWGWGHCSLSWFKLFSPHGATKPLSIAILNYRGWPSFLVLPSPPPTPFWKLFKNFKVTFKGKLPRGKLWKILRDLGTLQGPPRGVRLSKHSYIWAHGQHRGFCTSQIAISQGCETLPKIRNRNNDFRTAKVLTETARGILINFSPLENAVYGLQKWFLEQIRQKIYVLKFKRTLAQTLK